jgi:hypothetical protein
MRAAWDERYLAACWPCFEVRLPCRLLCRQRRRQSLVDIDKLRVAVGIIAAFLGLGVTLQTELLSLE